MQFPKEISFPCEFCSPHEKAKRPFVLYEVVEEGKKAHYICVNCGHVRIFSISEIEEILAKEK